MQDEELDLYAAELTDDLSSWRVYRDPALGGPRVLRFVRSPPPPL